MANERYPRGDNRPDAGDYGRDYGSGRDYGYSSAREYEAAGRLGGDRDRGGHAQDQGHDRSEYGARDYGYQRYGQRERFGRGQSGGHDRGQGSPYRSEGRHDREREMVRGHDYGAHSQGHDQEDRGFFDRAGDEVRSWFGDDEAERRRDMDQRYDERRGQTGRSRHDDDYHQWRSSQVAALDRDYDEYRRENSARFEQEFATWRTNRQGQRDAMKRVQEHQEVVGADGQHVGKVDKVQGDRILLTKDDKDAGGQHHSIPCGWITSVDDKVMLNKSAEEAKQAWRDENRNQARSGYGDDARGGARDGQDRNDMSTGHNLNRSFSGTY